MKTQVKIRKGNKVYEIILNIIDEKDCKNIISEINEEKRFFLDEIKRTIEELEK